MCILSISHNQHKKNQMSTKYESTLYTNKQGSELYRTLHICLESEYWNSDLIQIRYIVIGT